MIPEKSIYIVSGGYFLHLKWTALNRARDALNTLRVYFRRGYSVRHVFIKLVSMLKRKALLQTKKPMNYGDVLLNSYGQFTQTSEQFYSATSLRERNFQYYMTQSFQKKKALFLENECCHMVLAIIRIQDTKRKIGYYASLLYKSPSVYYSLLTIGFCMIL